LTFNRINEFLRIRLLRKESGDEKKNFTALVDRLVLKTMADQSPKAQYQAAKRRFQSVEDNAFHQGNFVINYDHDPRDRVAGDVSHQRDDRFRCGSTEQFRRAR
jgi:hypothetical protein